MVTRLSVCIKVDVRFKIRNDLMSNELSSIWVEVTNSHGRKVLVGNIYCEFQYLRLEGSDSGLPSAQQRIWGVFLNQWKAAGDKADTVVIGDTNLDFDKWTELFFFLAFLAISSGLVVSILVILIIYSMFSGLTPSISIVF